MIKAGLSTREMPYQVPSLAGTPKHSRVMLSAPSTRKFFGDRAYKYRGICRLSYPIQNGVIRDWNDMIQLWQYLYDDVLQIERREHPVLMTEAPKNPISNRIRITQIHLEYLESPSIYFVPPPVLTLYVECIALYISLRAETERRPQPDTQRAVCQAVWWTVATE